MLYQSNCRCHLGQHLDRTQSRLRFPVLGRGGRSSCPHGRHPRGHGTGSGAGQQVHSDRNSGTSCNLSCTNLLAAVTLPWSIDNRLCGGVTNWVPGLRVIGSSVTIR